jgi:hypothetical protein
VTEVEFNGLSVLGLPLDPAERVRDATKLATALLADAARALAQDCDPGMASAVRYALMMTQRAAEKAQAVSHGG